MLTETLDAAAEKRVTGRVCCDVMDHFDSVAQACVRRSALRNGIISDALEWGNSSMNDRESLVALISRLCMEATAYHAQHNVPASEKRTAPVRTRF